MQIELTSQRIIRLDTLHQSYTYGGLLLDQPTARRNNKLMESSKEHAETVVQAGAIHLIEPRQSLTTRGFLGNNHFILDPLQHAKDHNADEPHYAMRKEVLQRLPLLTCSARFISDPLGAEPDEDGSELGIVWYQDEFAIPVDEVVIEQIKTLDWEKLAVSYWH